MARSATAAARRHVAYDLPITPADVRTVLLVAAAAAAEPVIKRKRTASVRLPKGYKPTEAEEFMSRRQQEYFRLKLLAWREEILSESRETFRPSAS